MRLIVWLLCLLPSLALGQTLLPVGCLTGTSGATCGLLNANKTDSGTNTFSGGNTFSNVITAPGLDNSGTLSVGTTSATTINIGNSGATTKLTGSFILPNAQFLSFTDTSGTTTSGIGTTAGNLLEITGSSTGGSSQIIAQLPMRTTAPTFQFNTPLKFINTLLQSEAVTPTTTLTSVYQGNVTGVSGSVTSGSANYFAFVIAGDTLNTTTGGSAPTGASAIALIDNFGGAAMTGNRNGISATINMTATTGNMTNNTYYVADAPKATAAANDNGTNIAPVGNLTAFNPYVQLLSGATFWNGLAVAEFDFDPRTGSSFQYGTGILIVQKGTDAVAGTAGKDAGIAFSNTATFTTPGWNTGISFGSPVGWWPINSTGTIIGTIAGNVGGGPTYAAAFGIDFSAVTFSTGFLKSTGFLVDGSGNVTGAAFTAGTHAGVSCSGALTGAAVVTNGIVTHC